MYVHVRMNVSIQVFGPRLRICMYEYGCMCAYSNITERVRRVGLF